MSTTCQSLGGPFLGGPVLRGQVFGGPSFGELNFGGPVMGAWLCIYLYMYIFIYLYIYLFISIHIEQWFLENSLSLDIWHLIRYSTLQLYYSTLLHSLWITFSFLKMQSIDFWRIPYLLISDTYSTNLLLYSTTLYIHPLLITHNTEYKFLDNSIYTTWCNHPCL